MFFLIVATSIEHLTKLTNRDWGKGLEAGSELWRDWGKGMEAGSACMTGIETRRHD